MEKARQFSDRLFQFTTVQEITGFVQEEFNDILPYRETED
jgi:hypothetical protein